MDTVIMKYRKEWEKVEQKDFVYKGSIIYYIIMY